MGGGEAHQPKTGETFRGKACTHAGEAGWGQMKAKVVRGVRQGSVQEAPKKGSEEPFFSG